MPIVLPGMLVADVAGLEAGAASALAATALALLGAAILARAAWRLRGTTLVAPCLWALAALLSVAVAEIAVGLSGGERLAWAAPLRFAAAVGSFCPPLAVLGAKRPQHLPWQFIVLSLWVVLALPALEVLALHPGQPLQVQGLRAWILPALLLLGAANQVGTRFWPSALLAALAQIVLLLDHLPLPGVWLGSLRAGGSLTALALVDVALLLAALGLPRGRKAAHPLDHLWLEFRDAFGVLWALRLAERVNASAKQFGWDAALQWHGFTRADGAGTAADIPPETLHALRQNLKNLLRRFLSPKVLSNDDQSGGTP